MPNEIASALAGTARRYRAVSSLAWIRRLNLLMLYRRSELSHAAPRLDLRIEYNRSAQLREFDALPYHGREGGYRIACHTTAAVTIELCLTPMGLADTGGEPREVTWAAAVQRSPLAFSVSEPDEGFKRLQDLTRGSGGSLRHSGFIS